MRSDCGATKLVTPSLNCGTVSCHRHHHRHHHQTHPQILPGITRRSVLELAAQIPNLEVEERAVTLHEVTIYIVFMILVNYQVLEAIANGKLLEMFGTGTAATIAQVGNIRFVFFTYWNYSPPGHCGILCHFIILCHSRRFGGEDHPIATPSSGIAANLLVRLSNITR